MAPLKFEDKIKEKLEQRAIQPSIDSWQRLSAQLEDTQNQKKGNKKIWIYSIAAIFVGVLIITSLSRKQSSTIEQINTQYVDNNKIIEKENIEIVQAKEVKSKSIEEDNSEIIPNNSVVNKANTSVSSKEDNVYKRAKVLHQKVISNDVLIKKEMKDDKTNVGLVESDKTTTTIKNQILPIDSLIIENKVEGVIAQIKKLQKNNTQVTDEEINRLLFVAQQEITTEKILKTSTVNASVLLSDVERELDETFKQRVFEVLKASFQKVKTAVVKRGN